MHSNSSLETLAPVPEELASEVAYPLPPPPPAPLSIHDDEPFAPAIAQPSEPAPPPTLLAAVPSAVPSPIKHSGLSNNPSTLVATASSVSNVNSNERDRNASGLGEMNLPVGTANNAMVSSNESGIMVDAMVSASDHGKRNGSNGAASEAVEAGLMNGNILRVATGNASNVNRGTAMEMNVSLSAAMENAAAVEAAHTLARTGGGVEANVMSHGMRSMHNMHFETMHSLHSTHDKSIETSSSLKASSKERSHTTSSASVAVGNTVSVSKTPALTERSATDAVHAQFSSNFTNSSLPTMSMLTSNQTKLAPSISSNLNGGVGENSKLESTLITNASSLHKHRAVEADSALVGVQNASSSSGAEWQVHFVHFVLQESDTGNISIIQTPEKAPKLLSEAHELAQRSSSTICRHAICMSNKFPSKTNSLVRHEKTALCHPCCQNPELATLACPLRLEWERAKSLRKPKPRFKRRQTQKYRCGHAWCEVTRKTAKEMSRHVCDIQTHATLCPSNCNQCKLAKKYAVIKQQVKESRKLKRKAQFQVVDESTSSLVKIRNRNSIPSLYLDLHTCNELEDHLSQFLKQIKARKQFLLHAKDQEKKNDTQDSNPPSSILCGELPSTINDQMLANAYVLIPGNRTLDKGCLLRYRTLSSTLSATTKDHSS